MVGVDGQAAVEEKDAEELEEEDGAEAEEDSGESLSKAAKGKAKKKRKEELRALVSGASEAHAELQHIG